MKLTTAGILAAISMTLTSAAVWTLTPPRSAQALTEVAEAVDSDPGQEADGEAEARFVIGSKLVMEGRLGHTRLAATGTGETLLYVDVTANGRELEQTAVPINLAIVVDRSGSMAGKPMINALEAASGMLRRLRDGDSVSVVAYDRTAETIVPTTVLDPITREGVVSRLQNIETRGHTCISCGVEAGMRMLGRRSGAIDRMLLLSDGEANIGIRTVEGFRTIAERCRSRGMGITSIGVDADYNERIMTALASDSNGHHYFVENPSDLPRVFDEELASLVSSVARDVELAVDLGVGAELIEVYGRSFRRDGDRVIVPLGTFSPDENKTLLARIRVPQGSPGRQNVADVQLAYTDLKTNVRTEDTGELATWRTADPNEASSLDPIVAGRLSRAETAIALREANELFAAGRIVDAERALGRRRQLLANARRDSLRRAKKRDHGKLDEDFTRQAGAIVNAQSGFLDAKRFSPKKPNKSRKAKVQIRSSASEAALSDL